jgi:molybdate/tungstate transport system permease protein
LLARRTFRGKAFLAAIMDLPLVIPHPVAGIALLLVLGRSSAVGSALYAAGLRVAGSPTGIICAMLFVSAPLYVSAARESFARVDARFEAVARTLGDDAWRAFARVTLPLSVRGLTAAAIVMWARAVSEFGAIVILTYNPKVASVLSYDRFTAFGLNEALPVAAVLVLLALVPLAALRALRKE